MKLLTKEVVITRAPLALWCPNWINKMRIVGHFSSVGVGAGAGVGITNTIEECPSIVRFFSCMVHYVPSCGSTAVPTSRSSRPPCPAPSRPVPWPAHRARRSPPPEAPAASECPPAPSPPPSTPLEASGANPLASHSPTA